MARIRIYQSFFNSPPLQRPDVRGITLENKADVRQKLPSLDGVVNASGLYYVFPLERTQVLGAPLVASADVRLRRLSLNGAIIASGANGPELWNVPVTVETVVTSGWEFQQPPLVVRRRTADPESDDLSSDVVGPIAAPPQSGWSIVLPELRRVRPAASLAALDSLSLPLGGDTDRPGWNVSLAELRQAKPRVGFADSIDSESWSPLQTVAAQPWGWSLPPPRPRVVPKSVFAGADLAPQAINPSPYGWTVTTNDLPQFRRKQALPESAGRLDQPQAQPYGATVVLPDIPQFRRKQALPDSAAGRLDRSSAIQTQSLGWIVELPHLTRGTNRGGILAGAILAPQTVTQTAATGWDVVLPDLPQFRRKQVRVESINRIDQPVTIIGIVYQEGWSIVLPSLPQFRRKQAVPELSGRIDKPTAAFQWGWSVVLPDLPRLRHAHAPLGLAQRLDTQVVIVVQQPIGWSVEPPFLRQVRPAKGGIFAGSFHEPPQIEPSTAVVTAEQTYFIANVGRFMGRRG